MRTYNFSPLLKGLQDGERALAAIQMIGNGTIEERAYAMTGATKSTVAYMMKLGITSASELTFTQRLRLSTMALWEQAAAWASSPLGMATIAAVGIFAIVKVVDALTVSLEESREALADLREEYNENEDELTTLNDELQTTIDRINELQGKDSLTFTEAEELNNLRRQNTELERQIALLETIQKQKNKEMNQAFVETMEKDLGNKKEYTFSNKYVSSNYSTQFGTDTKKYGKGRSVRTMSERDLMYSALVRYNELYAEWQNASDKNKEKIKKDLDDVQKYLTDKAAELASDAEGISYINNPTTDDEKAVNEWLDFVNDFNDKLMITMGQSGAKENALNRLIFGSFSNATSELKNLGKQGEVTARHLEDSRYDAFIQKCIDLGIIANDSEGSLAFLASGFNELSNAAKQATKDTDAFISSISEFERVLSGVQGLNKGFSQLDKIYADIYDKGDFDFGSILNNEEFSDAFGNLGDVYDDFIKTIVSYPNDIEACQEAFDNLATAYLNNSDALSHVTEESKDAVVAMLKQMGVADAEAIVQERLSAQMERLYKISRLVAELQEARATRDRITDPRGLSAIESYIDSLQTQIDELFNKPLNYDSITGYEGSKDSGVNGNEETWFEKQLKEHKHMLEMDKETTEEYLKWLETAYQKAYAEDIIDLDEYYKYQEEVYRGLQDLFKDYLNDIDHEVSLLESATGNSDEVINIVSGAMAEIERELEKARAEGLDENGQYIQYLEKQWAEYSQTITDIREQAESAAQSAIDELVEYRVDMLKKDIDNDRDALDKKLSNLQDFYDEQRKMLRDNYDEEEYLEEQSEKRKSVSDIKADLAMLENDNSAWAQKRKLELKEQLIDAEKELSKFEKDHALDITLDMLDEQQAAAEAQLRAEMDALDDKLNDPHALFNKALADIKNNTANLYQAFIEYNRKYGTGNDEDIKKLWEEAYKAGLEYRDTHDGQNPDGVGIGNYTEYTPTGSSDQAGTPSLSAGSTIQVKNTATHFSAKSGGARMASFVPGGVYTVYQTSGDEVLIGLNGEYTGWINKSDIVGYKSGTSYSIGGLAKFDEAGKGSEYIFESSDGSRYRMFAEGSKVLNADATEFLYNFATTGGSFLAKMLSNLLGLSGLGATNRQSRVIEVHQGDIIIQGNATERTVSEIRRAQRDSIGFVLKEFNKLNK